MNTINIFWFRRDLRLKDNKGLYEALHAGIPVQPLFIFDTNILKGLDNKEDKRIHFIQDALSLLQSEIVKYGATLDVRIGDPKMVFQHLIKDYSIKSIYTNEDYEPYAIERDKTIQKNLLKQGISFYSFKDQVIFSKNDILKPDQSPYTVFTPYYNIWLSKVDAKAYQPYPSHTILTNLYQRNALPIPGLQDIGFLPVPGFSVARNIPIAIIKNYNKTRDTPSIRGTSRLGVHLRFGTVSIRQLMVIAAKNNQTFLKELVWREFYHMILFHFPHTIHQSFKKEFDLIHWRNNDAEFEKWKTGSTGYPLVDAGMRELNNTGFMHNRVRMVTASFLCKHLLTDWRWGEAYFAQKLLDYDAAANIGGWQWCAGTGNDAAPYFRIFNPTLQQEKFDPDNKYVKKWVPEYGTADYPAPIVDHKEARARCLLAYKKAKNEAS